MPFPNLTLTSFKRPLFITINKSIDSKTIARSIPSEYNFMIMTRSVGYIKYTVLIGNPSDEYTFWLVKYELGYIHISITIKDKSK